MSEARGLIGTELTGLIIDASYYLKCSAAELEMFSWPEVFASTAGPRHGVGGQLFTKFQVYAFRQECAETGVMYCSGVRKLWNGKFEQSWET